MTTDNRILVTWLGIVCAAVYLMIVVGGVTRLTQSGLSMVHWQPLLGILPPLGEEAWRRAFEAYQQYPEYQLINRGMSLEAFKSIFYWEYGHRLLGRVIGLIFLVPFVILLARGRIARRWIPRLWVAFALGAIQGLVGWYMVKSGLVELPRVSHYRLALHLLLALFIMTYLLWLMLDIGGAARRAQTPLPRLTLAVAVLLTLQILFGAFTAGLDAGHGFNTYPLMQGSFAEGGFTGGKWLADAALMMTPGWLNFVENGAMVQFLHRWLGALLLVAVCLLAFCALRQGILVRATLGLLALTLGQFLLGIWTLLHHVPVVSGSLHQALGCLLVLVTTYLVYVTRKPAVTAAGTLIENKLRNLSY